MKLWPFHCNSLWRCVFPVGQFELAANFRDLSGERILKEYGNITYGSLNCYSELVSESSLYSYIQSFRGFYCLWISINRKGTFYLKLKLHRCFSLYTKKWKGQLRVSLFLVQCFNFSFNFIYHSLLKLPSTFPIWALLVFFIPIYLSLVGISVGKLYSPKLPFVFPFLKFG